MSLLSYAVTRPILEAAVDAALGFAHQPMPRDEPRVHSAGPDPDRLLMVGTASVAGVGVTSHQLGLGGYLARSLSAMTGRGADIEIEGSPTLTALGAQELIEQRPLGEYDAIVLFLGSREGIGFQPLRLWKRQLRDLLERISRVDAAPPVFVVATPPIYRYTALPDNLIGRLHLHLERQNQVTRAVCSEFADVTYLSFCESTPGTYQLGSTAYEGWAVAFAPAIAATLDCRGRRRVRERDEPTRQAALDALHVLDSDVDERYDRIARTARDLLGASGASVTFLDHDRQWIKSAVTMSRDETERASAFCNTTISRAELFVVEDTSAEDTFAAHPWVVGEERVRFYAGYPVESPSGERVGALCVVDTKPRHFSGAEAALLRDLALRVQKLLWAEARDSA